MNFNFTPEQEAIRSLAREFADDENVPNARRYDEEERFPEEVMDRLRDVGLFNLAIPEQYGGPGIDKISHALIVEEIARGCAGIATSMEANSLASYPMLVGGSEEQKKRFLPRLTEGRQYASFALTEPGAGSDVRSLRTTAERAGDHYILNGEKCFITNASYADFYVVLAKLKNTDRFVALVVERESGDLSVGESEKKMGLRSSNTASIIFEDVSVPVSNRIGEEGEGLKIFMKALSYARPMVGAQSVGVARESL